MSSSADPNANTNSKRKFSEECADAIRSLKADWPTVFTFDINSIRSNTLDAGRTTGNQSDSSSLPAWRGSPFGTETTSTVSTHETQRHGPKAKPSSPVPRYHNPVPVPDFFPLPPIIRPAFREHPLAPADPPKHPLPSHKSHLIQAALKAELDFLCGPDFDPLYIRVVPDLTQVFGSLTDAFGEPSYATLNTHFGEKKELRERTVIRNSAASERHSSGEEATEKKKRKIGPESFLYAGKTAELDQTRTSNNGQGKEARDNGWKGRKYSLHPSMKSRNLDILMFRTRLSHLGLMSLDLNADARRDAIEIADGINTYRGGNFGANAQANGLIRSLFRPAAKANPYCTTATNIRGTKPQTAGSGMFTNRTGSRKRNSDASAWLQTSDGKRKRRRESDVQGSSQERKLRRSMRIRRAANDGQLNQDIVKAAHDVEQDYKNGQPAIFLNWRLIRISAVVEREGPKVAGKVGVEMIEEVDCSWWAVPERALGGIF